jgi:hypothetical protein
MQAQLDQIEQKIDMLTQVLAALVAALSDEDESMDDEQLDLNGNYAGQARQEGQVL